MIPDPYRYYRHLIFDNSLTETNYAFSRGHAVAPSRLELIDGKLPVSKRRFVSPPTSLKLAWTSRRGGDWQAELHVERWRGRTLRLEGDTLSLWCYSEGVLAAEILPMMVLELRDGPRTRPLRLGELVPGLPAGEWVQVKIPLSAFWHLHSRAILRKATKGDFLTKYRRRRTPHALSRRGEAPLCRGGGNAVHAVRSDGAGLRPSRRSAVDAHGRGDHPILRHSPLQRRPHLRARGHSKHELQPLHGLCR